MKNSIQSNIDFTDGTDGTDRVKYTFTLQASAESISDAYLAWLKATEVKPVSFTHTVSGQTTLLYIEVQRLDRVGEHLELDTHLNGWCRTFNRLMECLSGVTHLPLQRPVLNPQEEDQKRLYKIKNEIVEAHNRQERLSDLDIKFSLRGGTMRSLGSVYAFTNQVPQAAELGRDAWEDIVNELIDFGQFSEVEPSTLTTYFCRALRLNA
jgi:hypothetical protein